MIAMWIQRPKSTVKSAYKRWAKFHRFPVQRGRPKKFLDTLKASIDLGVSGNPRLSMRRVATVSVISVSRDSIRNHAMIWVTISMAQFPSHFSSKMPNDAVLNSALLNLLGLTFISIRRKDDSSKFMDRRSISSGHRPIGAELERMVIIEG
jgi:hypothetical protein